MRYHGIGGGSAPSGFHLLLLGLAALLGGDASQVATRDGMSGRTRGEVGPPEAQRVWRVGRREVPDL